MNDLTPMPFGKYKGTPMQDVPASYLHWMWHNIQNTNASTRELFDYIRLSMSALKQEAPDLIWDMKLHK